MKYVVTVNGTKYTFENPTYATNWARSSETPNWHIEGTANGVYRSYKQQYDGGTVEKID